MSHREQSFPWTKFLLEILLYACLMVIYLLLVLRLLDKTLTRLFHENLVAYALAGLGVILVQGVALDLLTSFLLGRLRLGKE